MSQNTSPDNVLSAKHGTADSLAAPGRVGAGGTTAFGRCRSCYLPQQLTRRSVFVNKEYDRPYEPCQCGCADFWDIKEYEFKPRRRSFKHRARRFNQRYGVALCVLAALSALTNYILAGLQSASLGHDIGAGITLFAGGFVFGLMAAMSELQSRR